MEQAREPAEVVYTSGARWVGPKHIVITDLFEHDKVVFERYVIFRTPWIGLQVHKFLNPDNDRDLHNHPRRFWSLVLRGGYLEESRDTDGESKWRRWTVGRINRMPLNRSHLIRELFRVPTWTLVVVGAQRQTWGFATKDGFIEADDYSAYVRGNS